MPALRWVLLETPPADAAETMATDEAVLDAAVRRGEPVTCVRLYRWAAPALSIGAKQVLPPEVAERCRTAGVAVVRRPTGGGAVLHDGDLTYAVVAPGRGMGVLAAYRWVAAALAGGFRALGLQAAVVDHGGTGRALACFALPTGADLEVGGRKACGSAQVHRAGWFLQHGSIPVVDVRAGTAALLGTTAADTSTCLTLERPGTTWGEAAPAFEAGFRSAWGEPAASRPLDVLERALLDECVARRAIAPVIDASPAGV